MTRLVNYLGNERPQMLLCLHEEAAIAIAHGYAKVTGRAMATAVHSNVGLMHATMAIFNAWCDRMPMIVLGATGPVDAHASPALDRLDPHRARPGRAGARLHQMGRSARLSCRGARSRAARGLDREHRAVRSGLRQSRRRHAGSETCPSRCRRSRPARFIPPAPSAAPAALIEQAAEHAAARAKKPVILAGRVSRSVESWNARVALAEVINARVVTDLKIGASFPTDHPLHIGAPGTLPSGAGSA